MKSTLGDDVLLLESFTGEERVSTPFRFLIRALAENANIDIKGLLRKPLVISIVLDDGSERHIHGNISRMKLLGTGEDGLAAYQIEMVPWLWFLNLFSDCRIFPEKTTQQIVEKVFTDRGFSDFRFDLQGSYTAREYCVQYNETDFNFVSRLLEEEGISYYFEQTPDKHTLVLVDSNAKFPACAKQRDARFTPATGGHLNEQTVLHLEHMFQVHIGTVQRRDYDFTKPATDLFGAMAGTQPGVDYAYPGYYLTKSAGDGRARIRLEEYESRLQTVSGDSNCAGFECGSKFNLTEHFRDAANQEYILTSLSHYARNASYQSNADTSGFEYQNRFECIPASVPYRPPCLARKPVIRGAQTAIVVGKSGEEIWTDSYGRVKVQFYWDREGSANESSSCWIRVSQVWAGKMWGSIYTPRIGQEVIVTFLEGDPDRPIIVGRVYNADQMPPYPLPDEQTKSTIKSMSSKGGGGFNELRFEDKKGSEQIFLHAEKDLDIRVKNVREEWIGASRHLIVGGDKREKINKNEHSHVVGNRVEKIEGLHSQQVLGDQGITVDSNHSIHVLGDGCHNIDGNHQLYTGKDLYISAAGQMVLQADKGLTLSVGGNFITIDMTGVSVKGTMINLNSGGSALSGSEGTSFSPVTPEAAAAADNDKPGANTSAPSPHTTATLATQLDTLAVQGAETEEEPERTGVAAGPGGRASQPEYSTFPRDVDGEAVARVLTDAAENGTPFCEECQKAQQQQQQQSGGTN